MIFMGFFYGGTIDEKSIGPWGWLAKESLMRSRVSGTASALDRFGDRLGRKEHAREELKLSLSKSG
jgi:hypothetical protein